MPTSVDRYLCSIIYVSVYNLNLLFCCMQSSCCKPPTYCGLEFHNATYWTMPKAGQAVVNSDCKIWNNVQTELCFKCQSCKTIFYDIIKKGWKKLSLISFVMLFLLCCVQCYYLIWFINWSKGHPWQRVNRAWILLVRYISIFVMIKTCLTEAWFGWYETLILFLLLLLLVVTDSRFSLRRFEK